MQRFIYILSVLTLLYNGGLHAQQSDTAMVGPVKVHIGKTFDSAEMDKMSFHYDSLNRGYTGTAYPDFEGTTLNGLKICKAGLKGKVALLVFWMPTGGYSHIPAFNDLYNDLKSDTSFVMLSVTPEGDIAREFVQHNRVDFPVLPCNDYELCKQLNFHNGFPSFVVLNKAGVVALVSKGGIGADNGFFTTKAATIKDLVRKLE